MARCPTPYWGWSACKLAIAAAVLWAATKAEEAQAVPRLRESLLAEARRRIEEWYENKRTLALPFARDGVRIQRTKRAGVCDGPNGSDQVPVVFGEFDIEGVDPIDVFRIESAKENQSLWDHSISASDSLGEFPSDGVRGVRLLLPSGLLFVPPRELFLWTALSADAASEEYWIVFSSVHNERLHERRKSTDGAVEADNCLAAYKITKGPRGTHVKFTNQVNPHPPPVITSRSLFDITWGREVDFINKLRKHARQIHAEAKQASKGGTAAAAAPPRWMLEAAVSSIGPSEMRSASALSFGTTWGDLEILDEVGNRLPRAVAHPSGAMLFKAALPAAVATASLAALLALASVARTGAWLARWRHPLRAAAPEDERELNSLQRFLE